jgi:hypothetical protein
MGWRLETMLLENSVPVAKPKSSLFPVLVVLFLISYGLLTLLVVEQGETIQNQRSMITLLMGDTAQLNALKVKEIQRQRAEAQANGRSDVQTPSNQVTPQSNKNRLQTDKLQKALPLRPPKNVSDTPDSRRNLSKI